MPVVEAIKTPFAQWLRGVGFGEAAADSISDRLASYFVFALNDEWRRRSQEYACLKEALDTPFTRAGEEEQGWLRYSAWLQKQVDEPMFFEAFSLRQVYISLRAFYEERPGTGKEAELERKIAGEDQRKRITVDLAATLEAWMNNRDPRDAVRVISGGPGCGKSSFTRMFAAQQAAKNDRRIIFVPLHLFEPTDGVIGPGGVPEPVVRFVLRAPLPGERTITLPLEDEGGLLGGWGGSYALVDLGGQSLRVRFNPNEPRTLATAGAAVRIANLHDGRVSGETAPAHIAFGISRPVRTMRLGTPLAIGPFAISELGVRTADFGNASAIREEGGDPDEVVVTGDRGRNRNRDRLAIGADQLRNCSSITFDKRRRQVRLTCANP